ncbi:hypothetical protein D5F01_LYC17961 [Larimichthys crocea]|uniref:Uncharacterized protein n=1 Tax=Larimichthys crocea TaxID=215358 RepID=A0A6G0I079_LARCR|nr:hypothetical protein D5F01_LYC17961 [Larimichthys crocea]
MRGVRERGGKGGNKKKDSSHSLTRRCSSVSSILDLLVAPVSQHGGERGGAGYSSEGVDQTAGSPTSQPSGAGSLLCAHPVCCHVPFLDRALLRPLLLQWKDKIRGLQSAASPACLKLRHNRLHKFVEGEGIIKADSPREGWAHIIFPVLDPHPVQPCHWNPHKSAEWRVIEIHYRPGQ